MSGRVPLGSRLVCGWDMLLRHGGLFTEGWRHRANDGDELSSVLVTRFT